MSDEFNIHDLTRHELEGWLRAYTAPDTILEGSLPEIAQQIMSDPGYISAVRGLRAALYDLREGVEPCECDDPSCLTAEHHMGWTDDLRATLDLARVMEEALVRDVAKLIYESLHCECGPCKMRRMMPADPSMN